MNRTQEQQKEYYQKNKERIIAKVRERYAKKRDEICAENRQRYHDNRETYLANMKKYRETEREKWLRISRKANQEYKQRLRDEVLAAYGNHCECCGESEREFLTLDHKGGGGNIHRRAEGWKARGSSLYLRLKKQGFPKDKWRLLCLNCNFAIRLGGECPHKRVNILRIVEGIGC